MAENTNADLMERAEETPDLRNLQEELDYAWNNDDATYARTAWAEDIRFARWRGQSPDGLKHRERMGDAAKPYEGAPDSRIRLADGLINSLVDVLYAAFFGARVKTAPTTARALNAAQAGELRAIISWMIHGPLRRSLIDDVEWSAQVMETIGWVVLHPTWRKEKVMRLKTLTLEQIFALSQQADPASVLASAAQLVMDPSAEDAAIELFMQFFPGLDRNTARRVVRELRTDQTSDFPVEQPGPNVPQLRVLVPGQHFVLPPESTAYPDTARWFPVRMLFSEQMLRERAREENWNEEFTNRAAATKGQSIDQKTVETAVDTNMKDVEIFYMYQRRNSDAGVPGIYCTVMSMFVKPDGGKKVTAADYGFHSLLDIAHKQNPFIVLQTEVIGLRPMDARGVPEIVMTHQNEMKNSRDLTYIFQQLGTVPPLQKKGTMASKLPPGLAPAGIINNINGEWSWFQPPAGKPEVAFKLMEMVKAEVEDYFGIARADVPPSRSQARMQRIVMRWLAKWGEAFWQLSVLAYQHLSVEELTQILGRKPLLTADLVAQQQLMLWFEVRAMDNDWLKEFMANIMQLLSIDLGGEIDRSKLIALVLAYMDPTLGEEVTQDQQGAKDKIFKEVREEVNSVMQGNKPMLRQNDPTGKMRMLFASQIVQDNPEYQMALSPKGPDGAENPRFNPQRAENMKTLIQNYQHNYQESVLSKQQGRLGTRDTGSAPVQSGAGG